jgi:hypothetical protein
MYYYKILNEQGDIEHMLASSAPLYNGIEITEEEYKQYIPDDIFDEEYAEITKGGEDK